MSLRESSCATRGPTRWPRPARSDGTFFTIPHFEGYKAILGRLDRITTATLEDLLVEAWLDRAPKRVAQQYLASRS